MILNYNFKLVATLKEATTGSIVRAAEISERYKSMYNFSKKLARLGRLMRILFPKSSTSLPKTN